MAGNLPKWILDSKDSVTRTTEWNKFIEELHDAVEQQMKESKVTSFNDLKPDDRNLLVEKGLRALEGGRTYVELFNKLSINLDQYCNNEVARQLLEDFPINTKTDLVAECAEDGAISLLRKWPEMKSKLMVYFDQPLRGGLRPLAWRLFLENVTVRKTYVDLLTKNPRAAISSRDLEISQQCEKLLSSEPTFNELRGSVGAFYGMKALLSYYHALLKTKEKLTDTDFYLAVPFLFANLNHLPRNEPAPSSIVALLVEEYLTFMTSRPAFLIPLKSNGKQFSDEYISAVATVEKNIQKCPRGQDTIKALSLCLRHDDDKIITTNKARMEILGEGLYALLESIFTDMFVRYVNIDILLFIWDRFILGLDNPQFNRQFFPMAVATYLVLLTTDLARSSPDTAPKDIQKYGHRLTLPDFIFELQKNFKADLAAIIPNDHNRRPVFDPTQAVHPPWLNWHQDVIPTRTQPKDRKLAREQREAERQRHIQQQYSEEQRRRFESQQRHRNETSALRADNMQHTLQFEQDASGLKYDLENERQRHLLEERRAKAEIERLQREIEAMKGAKNYPPPSRRSAASVVTRYLVPPPPTMATHLSTITPTSEPSQQPQGDARNVVKNFINQIRISLNKVAHGEGRDRLKLDEETRENIKLHKEDIKEAEKRIFGRILKPGEWSKLPEEEQEEKGKEMIKVVNERMKARHNSPKKV